MNFLTKKLKALSLAITVFASTSTVAHADPLDDLREVLLSENYSIKYENITPPTREAMHEKMTMFNGQMLAVDNPYTMYQPVAGIVAVSGNTRYIETNSAMNVNNVAVRLAARRAVVSSLVSGALSKLTEYWNKPREYEYATCTLTKDGEQFIFTRITDKDKVEYVGYKKGKVKATKLKKGYKFGYMYNFGDNDLTKALNAVLPNDKKAENLITYSRAGSGTLSNGQYYVDLKADTLAENTVFDAIRYYFDGDTLVKIEAGQYYRTQQGKMDGTRTIINVYEVNANPDTEYFSLPDGLKDVTKRNNEAEGEN